METREVSWTHQEDLQQKGELQREEECEDSGSRKGPGGTLEMVSAALLQLPLRWSHETAARCPPGGGDRKRKRILRSREPEHTQESREWVYFRRQAVQGQLRLVEAGITGGRTIEAPQKGGGLQSKRSGGHRSAAPRVRRW